MSKMKVGDLYFWQGEHPHSFFSTYLEKSKIWNQRFCSSVLKSKEIFCVLEADFMDYKILTLHGEVGWIRVECWFQKDFVPVSI